MMSCVWISEDVETSSTAAHIEDVTAGGLALSLSGIRSSRSVFLCPESKSVNISFGLYSGRGLA